MTTPIMPALGLCMVLCGAGDSAAEPIDTSVAVAIGIVQSQAVVPAVIERVILRYERRCGPAGCVDVPVYAEVSPQPAADRRTPEEKQAQPDQGRSNAAARASFAVDAPTPCRGGQCGTTERRRLFRRW